MPGRDQIVLGLKHAIDPGFIGLGDGHVVSRRRAGILGNNHNLGFVVGCRGIKPGFVGFLFRRLGDGVRLGPKPEKR